MDTPQFNASSSNISLSPSPQQPSPPIPVAYQPQSQPLSSSSASLPPGLPDVPYKTRLQSFTQKCNISLPMYINVNEGRQHDPKFRSTIWVDGMKYTSPNTFSRLRAAEADVARMALENLHVKFKTKERPVTHEGTTYIGDAARSKKEAEQLAARNAIMSILDGATSGLLYETIKSKYSTFGAVRSTKSECINASSATVKHVPSLVAVPVAANGNETKVALPVPSFNQECQMREHVSSVQAITITEVPNLNLLPGPEQSTAGVSCELSIGIGSGALSIGDGSRELSVGDGSGSKKRKRNKSKANKKLGLE
ncbi:Double-stranded RNA-binding protein 4 [Glycine soja]|uniref:Double-stranded RNA-binding protein 4 n=1 Tax=Glycine soja TaxID=3848 RepID=A0A445FY36_GLYSO|nr:Double-stranded RNA-binding protein 4 [Glycine soja]